MNEILQKVRSQKDLQNKANVLYSKSQNRKDSVKGD
jgi:hypothetical protein